MYARYYYLSICFKTVYVQIFTRRWMVKKNLVKNVSIYCCLHFEISIQVKRQVTFQFKTMQWLLLVSMFFFTESKEFPKSSQAEAPIVRAAESRKSSIWKKNVDSVTVDRVNSYVTFGVKFLTCIQTNILLFSYGYWRSVFLLIWLSAENLKLVSVSPRAMRFALYS